MSFLSTTAANLMLQWFLTTDSVTRPTAWYISLHTGDPGTTGANEVTTGVDADYVRQAITFATPAAKQALSNAAVSWTAAAGTAGYTVTHIGLWSAATTGTFYGGKLKSVAIVVTPSKVTTFATGTVVLTQS